MPFKTDKLSLDDPFLRRNTKLLPCQRERIVALHNSGASIHSLSRMFKVSRRLIQFVIYPERMDKVKEHHKDRGGSSVYYKKEKHTDAIREHRQYKYKTIKHTTK
jgi:hypothetical protein